MCRDNEFQAVHCIASFDQVRDVDGELNEVVLIKRTDGVINEDIFEVIKLIRLALIDFSDESGADDLIQKAVENAPDEVTFFALRYFEPLWIGLLSFPLKTGPLHWPRKGDWAWRGSDIQTKIS